MTEAIHIYPTLRCGAGCEYCSNAVNGAKPYAYQEADWDKWVEAIARGKFQNVVVTGGEPLLYEGLADLLDCTMAEDVMVYTNLMHPITPILDKVENTEGLRFRCSYHPHTNKFDIFLENLQAIEEKKIPFTIHLVLSDPEIVELKSNLFRQLGYEARIDYDQRLHWKRSYGPKKVKCSLPVILVAPDGGVHHCVSRMIRGAEPEGDFFRGHFDKVGIRICDEANKCTACDLAAAFQEEIKN